MYYGFLSVLLLYHWESMSERITVSMDEKTKSVLTSLMDNVEGSQSETVRNALHFYEANIDVANEADQDDLWKYNKALASQDHVLLDRDFMHLFLTTLAKHDALEDFLEEAKQVAAYHVPEYEEDFDSIIDLFDWLEFCGFLQYLRIDDNSVQLIFYDRHIKKVMADFTVNVLRGLGYDVEFARDGVTKVVLEIPDMMNEW